MISDQDAPPSESELRPPTPRWVKMFALFVGLLALVFIILHLTGNSLGNHGPR